MNESEACIWVDFKCLCTALACAFPAKCNTGSPIFVEVVTYFRDEFVGCYSGVTIVYTVNAKATTYINLALALIATANAATKVIKNFFIITLFLFVYNSFTSAKVNKFQFDFQKI